MSAVTDPPLPSKLGLATLAMLALSTWVLSHGYAGIFHDARLYTLQALARLHPDTLTADVFLKFGSQDRFTVFSPLYAEVIRWLGVDSAAALLTLLGQWGFLLAGGALACCVMPRALAIGGLFVLLAIPGVYGADQVFTCMESFLTPRMASEALVLAALAAALTGRTLWAVAALLTAVLLHPLMAMAGVGALYCLYVGQSRPVTAIALFIVSLKAVALATYAMPIGPWGRFDPDWLALIDSRSPYLFLRHWTLDDWAPVVVHLSTLGLGASIVPRRGGRLLCAMALATAAGGVVLSALGGDLFKSVLVTQLQPWRCLWLATAVSALMVPYIVWLLGRGSQIARTTALLLVAAWLFTPNAYALVAAFAALGARWGTHRLKPSETRWLYYGAGALLAIALVWRMATNLEFTGAYYLEPSLPLWLRRTISVVSDGSLPVTLALVIGWLSQHPRRRAGLIVMAGMTASLCVALLPHMLTSWVPHDYSASRMATFAAWRDTMPLNSNVFWPDAPVGTWVLLDRPSYISMVQTSGLVFSRATALELERRAVALDPPLSRAQFLRWDTFNGHVALTGPELIHVCASGEFDYLVTPLDLGTAAAIAASPVKGDGKGVLRLYRCGAQARAAAAAT